MTTIDNRGLNAVVPATAGTPLRIRVLLMAGKANGRGVWLIVTPDRELATDTLKTGENTWLLEQPQFGASKAAKCLDTWARKINVHARTIASYFEQGDTESIKRLVNSI